VEAVRPRLRVGVFADSARQPRWVVEALAKVASSDHAELALVSTGAAASLRAPLLWSAYSALDRKAFGGMDFSSLREIESLVAPGRRVPLPRDGIENGWQARIRDARLDVAFVLGDVDTKSLEGLARFGTWRYAFGEDQFAREPLAGVREVLDATTVIASGIRIQRPGLPDRLACPSWSRTFPFSVARSRHAMFAKSSDFIARALRDLHTYGARWIDEGTKPAKVLADVGFPGTLGVARDVAKMGARIAQRAVQRVTHIDQWSIAWRFAAEESWDGELEVFFRLEPPKDRFWADPFPITVAGRHYIFFEELPYSTGKAYISVIEVRRDGTYGKPQKVLERDYHLSYPFLLEEDGELYMIPETGQNHTVEIYKCVDFPTQWRLERVLLRDVFCVDATLHQANGKWWMFANAAQPGSDINDELHIYSADRVLGEWTPHRRNPVKSDVRSSRPAGRLFTQGGELFRPGQICAPLYGSGITLHRVTRLTQDDYEEQEDRRIVPRGKFLGLHTINRAGDFSVTDAFMRRPRFA
jgi:hypothetical protein